MINMHANYTREIIATTTPVLAYEALTTGFDK